MRGTNWNDISKNEEHIVATMRRYSSPKTLGIRNISRRIETADNTYTLTRLTSRQYEELHCFALLCSEDPYFEHFLSEENAALFNSLPKLYAALRTLFGEKQTPFGQRDRSLWYPFLLSFEKDGESYDYMIVFDSFAPYSVVEIWKICHEDDEYFHCSSLLPPLDHFPLSEIRSVVRRILDYMNACLDIMMPWYSTPFLLYTNEQ